MMNEHHSKIWLKIIFFHIELSAINILFYGISCQHFCFFPSTGFISANQRFRRIWMSGEWGAICCCCSRWLKFIEKLIIIFQFPTTSLLSLGWQHHKSPRQIGTVPPIGHSLHLSVVGMWQVHFSLLGSPHRVAVTAWTEQWHEERRQNYMKIPLNTFDIIY